ncbi:MAG: formylmethanofuran--tetrahydromethanopterin N-formyltransferase [Nitrososphaeria archaeon]|nr:formylmethanofuran--tetrahydromethanopterin N-formyltransferase [Nitrososphaeria archaeon]NIN51590.1 formylmethanofuran--tetrahydromethanopterin N-formyltransferase [Nitrososphaeria archaeon]NIQ32075.1 formylmethanofuran--tetrahydromethanopterin N-formyltransferase [Nitrososphaeria archaeon]
MKINGVEIGDEDFAEAFPMIAGRVLITAKNKKWALTAARTATGFASSIILSPAEAGIEGRYVPPKMTPDGRIGAVIQIYHRTGRELKAQMITRLSQCVLTCATTSCYDFLPQAKKRIKVGTAIRLFGDGFEERDTLDGRRIWRIPVMEGEFIIEDRFGIIRAIAGGNFIIMAESPDAGLKAAEEAVRAIKRVQGVILPFPGGIIRSGSKVGSMKYKLGASTNHPFCPTLRDTLPETQIPEGVKSVFELVFNGLTPGLIKKSTAEGIRAAANVPGVRKITAVNFGGKLGPVQVNLKEALESA